MWGAEEDSEADRSRKGGGTGRKQDPIEEARCAPPPKHDRSDGAHHTARLTEVVPGVRHIGYICIVAEGHGVPTQKFVYVLMHCRLYSRQMVLEKTEKHA